MLRSDLYTLAEGIMISVRSFQRSKGDVSDPVKYMYSWSASQDESVCPSVRPFLRKLVFQFSCPFLRKLVSQF